MTESGRKRIPDLYRREAEGLLGYVGLSLVQSDCGHFQTFTDQHLPGCSAIFPGGGLSRVGLLFCVFRSHRFPVNSLSQVSCQLALTGFLSSRSHRFPVNSFSQVSCHLAHTGFLSTR